MEERDARVAAALEEAELAVQRVVGLVGEERRRRLRRLVAVLEVGRQELEIVFS